MNEYRDYRNTTEYKFNGIDDLSNILRLFRVALSLIEEAGLLEEYRHACGRT